jgi:aminoglycoside 2'-N-acetyltransferase I
MGEELKLRRHTDLTSAELDALQELFDTEYFSEYGRWNPDAPYGYSPADFHVLAYQDSALTAHVGFQLRRITVGRREVTVAGVGGCAGS